MTQFDNDVSDPAREPVGRRLPITRELQRAVADAPRSATITVGEEELDRDQLRDMYANHVAAITSAVAKLEYWLRRVRLETGLLQPDEDAD